MANLLCKSSLDWTPEEVEEAKANVRNEAERMIAEARARKAKRVAEGEPPVRVADDRRGTAAWIGR